MTTTPRYYRGESPEQRRAQRRAALLDAALDLLTAEGWERVTVRSVCAKARLNDRYFHESFRDRDELLLAVLDDVTAQCTQVVVDALDGTPQDLRLRVRAVVEAGMAFLEGDPRRGRLLVESQATEALRDRRAATIRMLATIAADQTRELLGEKAPPEPDAELLGLTLVGGAFELFTMWIRDDLPVTRDHLADFLVALLLTNTDLAAALDREAPR
ncbi:TetR/AcrR family transcriptional regulator [Saccharopolyspora sp. ID03-671]|uniref:TetR/AcrR family transcriptional regulator n=1 Tax=Saccharopolyspora sp. ID03-671 TaxID=3073066 RepID=UPI0032488ABD